MAVKYCYVPIVDHDNTETCFQTDVYFIIIFQMYKQMLHTDDK